MNSFFLFFIATTVWGCSFVDTQVLGSKGEEKFADLYKIDRKALGFTEIPKGSKLFITYESGGDAYDAVVSVILSNTKSRRRVYFKKIDDEYKWVGEQESILSGKLFDSVDGLVQESLDISFEKKRMFGSKEGKTNIYYSGNDPRLKNKHDLTISDVAPIIREWGIEY